MLHEAAAQHHLEHVAAQAVGNAPADVGLVLFVGQGAGGFAHGVEVVGGEVVVADDAFQFVERVRFAVFGQFHQGHGVVEMVEGNDILVQDVEHVGGVVLCLCGILDVDVLEVAHGVERRVAVEAAVGFLLALHVETGEEVAEGVLRAVMVVDAMLRLGPVGEAHGGAAVPDGDAGHGRQGDEGAAVVVAVVVGTLHQRALRVEVAHLQVGAHGGVEVAENLPGGRVVMECFHLSVWF